MANTFTAGTTVSEVNRLKYLKSTLQHTLKNAMVAEAICNVDRSDLMYIANPYSSRPTATVQTIAGTYAITAFTTTDDTLTVTDEIVYAEHIYGHEVIFSRFDLYADRMDEMSFSIAYALDKWVLNEIADNATTTTYDTPAGGFTTAANFITIMGALQSKVAGYSEAYRGTFLLVENTDLAGIIPAAASSGFNTADSVLRNGLGGNYMGTDIYVVRTGTFVDATASTVSGTKTWLNAGHRLFGVKGVATYAAPRGIQIEEKFVTATTGKEIVVYGLVGFKLWTRTEPLIVNITLK